MRLARLFSGLAAALIGIQLSAQTVQPSLNVNLVNDLDRPAGRQAGMVTRAAVCGPDTLTYGYFKEIFYIDTARFSAFGIRNNGQLSGFGQRYNVPVNQTVTLNGTSFYAWSAANTAFSCSVLVEVFNVSPTGVPTGAALASATTLVDTTFGNGLFSALRRNVNFATPVTVSADFIITVRNLSDTTMGIVGNNYVEDAGKGERLSVARFNNNWISAFNLSNSAGNLDMDFMIEPFVTYNINALFAPNAACIVYGKPISFTNQSSDGFVRSKFFNLEAFFANFDSVALDSVYFWDLGNGTASFADNPTVTYPTSPATAFDVELFTSIFQNNFNLCADSVTISLPASGPVDGSFTYSVTNNLQVSFTSTVQNSASLQWVFGDGTTSNLPNPTKVYTTGGQYTVLLITTGCDGGRDTARDVLNLFNVGIEDQLGTQVSLYPNPVRDLLEVALELEEAAQVQIRITDLTGRTLLTLAPGRMQTGKVSADVAALPRGFYLVRIQADDRQSVRRIWVE